MLIEIKKNIITEAIKRKNQKQNDPLDLLFQMAICAKKGHHLVWVPSLEKDRVLRKELSALITEANVNALCYSEAMHSQDVGWLSKRLSTRTVLSYEKETPGDGFIIVNPREEPDFQPHTELFFLVENIADADFYNLLLKFFRSWNRLTPYESMFYPLMGGGATIAKVMENEVCLRKHFCFSIVDSDKHSPKGPTGQTGQDLLGSLFDAPGFCGAYRMKEVLEIENLIPERVVRFLYPIQAGEIDIFSRGASYYDMKYGLKLYSLLNDKDNDYWKALLPEKQPLFALRDSLKKTHRKARDFEEALKANNDEILPGFCVHLLQRVMNKDIDAKDRVLRENIKAFDLLHKTEYSHLSNAQQKEWDSIGLALFSWSCGMKAR